MTTKRNSRRFILALIYYLLVIEVLGLPVNTEEVSKCVMDCISHPFDQTGYINESHNSLCRDKGFQVRAHRCVVQDCTVIETFRFINSTNSACGISNIDNRYVLRTTTIAVSVLAAFFLAIRVVSKITGPLSWGADDTLLALSSALAISLSISTIQMIHWGLGRNIWVLTEHQITTFFKFLVVNEYSYLLSLSLIKASILVFFYVSSRTLNFAKLPGGLWATSLSRPHSL
ncbi:hypothetical protein BKA59DRAFT_312227 [Fusarium tricinctum]|uniref:Rhodopsin domain-containing protein n=1 Tax=Fusarium tricinctum TaxID=61284 RepID=A0A8K0RS12_9HYPO|nr:hypothetical protein BKA59DRAFT_312227 [Fusarium tricinctum]